MIMISTMGRWRTRRLIAAHLAGAVDGALGQGRPAQVVLGAADVGRLSIMGPASVEDVVVMDDCSLVGADRRHLALPTAVYYALT